jgi:hypothetical protein
LKQWYHFVVEIFRIGEIVHEYSSNIRDEVESKDTQKLEDECATL